MKLRLLSLMLLLGCFVALPAKAQLINSHAVGDPNFNSTTPTADSGYFSCLFKNSGSNVITECPISGNSIENLAFSLAPVMNLNTGNVIQFACTTASSAVVPTITGLAK